MNQYGALKPNSPIEIIIVMNKQLKLSGEYIRNMSLTLNISVQ
jgi:hypothetical protein